MTHIMHKKKDVSWKINKNLIKEINEKSRYFPHIIFAPNCTIRHPVSMPTLKKIRHYINTNFSILQ